LLLLLSFAFDAACRVFTAFVERRRQQQTQTCGIAQVRLQQAKILSRHFSILQLSTSPFVVASMTETSMKLQPVFIFDLPS
jgi:hypothetical protein